VDLFHLAEYNFLLPCPPAIEAVLLFSWIFGLPLLFFTVPWIELGIFYFVCFLPLDYFFSPCAEEFTPFFFPDTCSFFPPFEVAQFPLVSLWSFFCTRRTSMFSPLSGLPAGPTGPFPPCSPRLAVCVQWRVSFFFRLLLRSKLDPSA